MEFFKIYNNNNPFLLFQYIKNNIHNNTHKDIYLYISFGAKYNESNIVFDNGENILSNVSYQLIPEWYRNNINDIIIILIDIFNEINLINNINYIKQLLININNNKILFLIYNLYNIEESNNCISNFIISLKSDILNYYNINNNNIAVCNYIKFKLYDKYEENISKFLFELLKQVELDNNYYEWFGYNIHNYNLIVKHKNYNYIKYTYYNNLFLNFINIIKNESVKYYNISSIFNNTINNNNNSKSYKNYKKNLNLYLCNCIDITAPAINSYFIYNYISNFI